MKNWPILIAMSASIAGISGCAQKQEAPVEVPKAAHVFSLEKLDRPVFFNTPEDVKNNCDLNLGHIERLRNEITAVTGKHTQENTLERFNEIDIASQRIWGIGGLMLEVQTDKNIRAEIEQCHERTSKMLDDIWTNPKLYDAVQDVDLSTLDEPAKRYANSLLISYRKSGIDKDEATRQRLNEIDAELGKLNNAFYKNLNNDRKTIQFTADQLAGLPEDFMKTHVPDEKGMITISTDSVDYNPVLRYAKDESTRAALFKLSTTRAYPANEEVIKKMLKLRYEYAQRIGFDDWASYRASSNMVKDSKTIANFLDKIATISKPRSDADIEAIMQIKKADNPDTDGFYEWDRYYYIEALRKQKNDFDAKAVRQYFPYEKVKRGVLNIASTIYGISFQTSNLPVWDPKVEAYDVYENEHLIARIYLDMHPRAGKEDDTWAMGVYLGVEGLQLPVSLIQANFPEPTPDNPALMDHRDVVTFFHEFGHLLSHILAGRHHWSRQSGISEMDFVEVPSQLFEEWAWDYDVLKRFATNEAGEVIPKDLVDKMKQSADVGKGFTSMHRVSTASLAYEYHKGNPDNFNLVKMQNDILARTSPFKQFENNYTFASFHYLMGYNSTFYSYLWSLALVKELALPFKEKGYLDIETSHRYRDNILSVGSAIDTKDQVKNFLGHDYNFEAFKQWLEE